LVPQRDDLENELKDEALAEESSAVVPSASDSLDRINRRDLLRALAGLGFASATGGVLWGVLEATMPRGPVQRWHKSVCRYCGTGCGVMVGMNEAGVAEVRGDSEAHNAGKLCIKGSLLPLLNKAPGRLKFPMIRKNGKLVRSDWNTAMSLVASQFEKAIAEHGPNSVAYFGSGQLFIEESYTANKLFKAGIGTNNVDGNPRLCMASAAVGYTKTFGKDEPAGCYEDIDHAEVFFIIGANPAECHQPLFERIKARKSTHPNTVIVCVDPRRTLTAERADLHLAPRPGSDLLFLWAMAHAIVEGKLFDETFVRDHVAFQGPEGRVGWEGLCAFLEDYSPEKVQERVGIPAAQIRDVASRFAGSQATMSLWTMGLNQRVDGVALNTTMNALHLITGQINKKGATPMSLTGQANACGGVRDTGSLAHLLPHGRFVKIPQHRAEMEKLWGVPAGRIQPKPGLDALRLFQAMNDGGVRCVLNMCTNPAQSMPNLNTYAKGMERCFFVVVDVFEDTRSTRYADVVLPAALWVEKEGVFGQSERRYQLVEKLLDPPGEARSDLEILVDLAQRLGLSDVISAKTAPEVWDEYRKLSSHSKYDFSGITRARLRELRGLQWPCPDEKHPGTARRYIPGDPFVSAGKKHDFYGMPDGRALVHLTPYAPRSDETTEEYPLVLNTGRILEQWHTGTMTDRIAPIRNGTPRGHFEIHGYDARRLGIKDGDKVEVKSRYGRLEGACRVTTKPLVGTVFATFYDAEFLINVLVTDKHDPISKQPDYKTTAVSVRKLG
jgi:nitrate reductase (cytochrome)